MSGCVRHGRQIEDTVQKPQGSAWAIHFVPRLFVWFNQDSSVIHVWASRCCASDAEKLNGEGTFEFSCVPAILVQLSSGQKHEDGGKVHGATEVGRAKADRTKSCIVFYNV